MKIAVLLSFIFIFGAACDQVKLRPKSILPSDEKIQSFEGGYVTDGKGGLFQNIKWYEYEMATHIIWPLQDVFAIKTPTAIYKLQIRSYYDEAGVEPGVFRLGLGKEIQENSELTVDARACGNPFTNPDHAACLTDPQRNIFTYLDLETLKSRAMSEAEALQDSAWDIAFRGTDIKLNAGLSGPSNVVGALLNRFDFFQDASGRPDAVKLRDRGLQARAADAFVGLSPKGVSAFYLPDGIDRVMHERDWFIQTGAIRQALPQNWWILKTVTDQAFAKIRVLDIQEKILPALAQSQAQIIETEVIFEYFIQAAGSPEFSATAQKVAIQLSTQARSSQICISFLNNEFWSCRPDRKDWDLRLLAVNAVRNGQLFREWRIFVAKGARGPLDAQAADQVRSGLAN